MIFLGSFLRDYAPIQGAAQNAALGASGKAPAVAGSSFPVTITEGSRSSSSSSSSMQPAASSSILPASFQSQSALSSVPAASMPGLANPSSQLIVKQSPSHILPQQPPAPPVLAKASLPEHQMVLHNLLQKSDADGRVKQQPAKRRKIEVAPTATSLVPPTPSSFISPSSLLPHQMTGSQFPIVVSNPTFANLIKQQQADVPAALSSPVVPILSPTYSVETQAVPLNSSAPYMPISSLTTSRPVLDSPPVPLPTKAASSSAVVPAAPTLIDESANRWLPSPQRGAHGLLHDDLSLNFVDEEEDPLDLNQFI
eukprot:TRINITY_DN1203_c0_g2_i1.p2 TRINITY_DN1203_c0_g2~~TRINITY_DN1203_c0_g2_i1.p2  ORF type:complete len:311 (+),score=67.11 TRINITY_DN1203_c0_g2_i1:3-935(+)